MAVTYAVTVTNDSTAEELSLDTLWDDKFGDITILGSNVLETNCDVPKTIAIGGKYSCTFVGKVTDPVHTNTVTGTLNDDEGGTITPSDSATVTFK